MNTPIFRAITGISGYNEDNQTEWRGGALTPLAVTQEVSAPMPPKITTPPFPDPNPSGICLCGCGLPVAVIRLTNTKARRYRGHHALYIQGHNGSVRDIPPDPNPSGLCFCGCGHPTRVQVYSNRSAGLYRGHHARFISGHHFVVQREGPDYVEEDRGFSSPCWIWQGALNQAGYGEWHTGEDRTAHRAYYRSAYGSIPDGTQLDHLCRVRACVNPEHLEPVSPAVNTQRGAKAKLSPQDVVAIRKAGDGVSTSTLAETYGVSERTIRNIRALTTWRNISQEDAA